MLITLDEAYAHLRVSEDEDALDVALKAEEASEIVLDYVTHEDKADWSEDTAPGVIKAAVKLVLTGLYDDRAGDPLSPAVKNVLRRYRDPTLA